MSEESGKNGKGRNQSYENVGYTDHVKKKRHKLCLGRKVSKALFWLTMLADANVYLCLKDFCSPI